MLCGLSEEFGTNSRDYPSISPLLSQRSDADELRGASPAEMREQLDASQRERALYLESKRQENARHAQTMDIDRDEDDDVDEQDREARRRRRKHGNRYLRRLVATTDDEDDDDDDDEDLSIDVDDQVYNRYDFEEDEMSEVEDVNYDVSSSASDISGTPSISSNSRASFSSSQTSQQAQRRHTAGRVAQKESGYDEYGEPLSQSTEMSRVSTAPSSSLSHRSLDDIDLENDDMQTLLQLKDRVRHLKMGVDLQHFDANLLLHRLDYWFTILCPSKLGGRPPTSMEVLDHVIKVVYGVDENGQIGGGVSLRTLQTNMVENVTKTYNALVARNVIDETHITDESRAIKDKLVAMSRNIANAYECAMRMEQMRLGSSENSRAQLPGDPNMHHYYTPHQEQDDNDYQRLLRFILNRCSVHGLVKRENDEEWLYRPVYTPFDARDRSGGHFTFSYKRTCTFEQFIELSVSPKEMHWQQWKWLNSGKGRIRKNLADALRSTYDWQLPFAEKDRGIHSWLDGVYFVESNIFYDYTNEKDMAELNMICRHSDTNRHNRRCAVKFHNAEFKDKEKEQLLAENNRDWYHALPTKTFQKILDDQDLSEDVCKWIYIMCGRMLYATGALDNWQIQLFIKGIAGSGKSTWLRFMMRLFEFEDIGIMSNRVEPNFALFHMMDCMAWFALDVKENWNLDQTTWQSIVTGEETAIARKYMKAIVRRWTAPGMIASNVFPDWKDNSESVSRRILLVILKNIVRDVDPNIENKLIEELPMFFKKINVAYLGAVKDHKDADIWKVVPQEFRDNRRKLRQATNALDAYLDCSDKIALRKGAYIRFDDFKKGYQQYVRQNYDRDKQYKTDTLKATTANTTFQRMGIDVVWDTRPEECWNEDSKPVKTYWVTNVCSREDAQMMDDLIERGLANMNISGGAPSNNNNNGEDGDGDTQMGPDIDPFEGNAFA